MNPPIGIVALLFGLCGPMNSSPFCTWRDAHEQPKLGCRMVAPYRCVTSASIGRSCCRRIPPLTAQPSIRWPSLAPPRRMCRRYSTHRLELASSTPHKQQSNKKSEFCESSSRGVTMTQCCQMSRHRTLPHLHIQINYNMNITTDLIIGQGRTNCKLTEYLTG